MNNQLISLSILHYVADAPQDHLGDLDPGLEGRAKVTATLRVALIGQLILLRQGNANEVKRFRSCEPQNVTIFS